MNSSGKGLVKNVFFNVILTLSSVIMPLITFPYISRVLGPSGTGTYDFLNSFIGYFSMFATLGIPTYAIRSCATARDDKIKLSQNVHEIIMIQMCSTLIAIVALVVCFIFIDKISNSALVGIAIAIGLFSQAFGFNWLCSALEKYAFISIKGICINIITLIFIFIFVKQPDDLLKYAIIMCGGNVLSTITSIFYLKKYVTIKPLQGYNLKQHVKPIIIFFCFTIATTIYTNVDRVMIGFMLNDTEVGLYSAGYKIAHIILTVVTSISAVLLPRLSYYMENKRMEEFEQIIRNATNVVLMLAIPSIIYFMAFADDAILFFLGDQYAGSVTSMRILLPTILIIGLTNLMGIQYLVPLGKEKHVMYSTILGGIVDIVINVPGILLIGIEGAAIGTLCAELAVFIYQFIIIGKERKIFLAGVNIKSILVLCFLSIPAMILLKIFVHMSHFYNLLISVSVFGVMYIITLFLTKNEVVMLIINKIRKKKEPLPPSDTDSSLE